MVPTGSDESKLRTFQGPFQDQISHDKDFYSEFHNADIHVPNTQHICGNFLLFLSFWDITSDLTGYMFHILKKNWQNVHFGIDCLLKVEYLIICIICDTDLVNKLILQMYTLHKYK